MIKQASILWKIFFFISSAFLFFQTAWAGQINIGSISKEPTREIKKFLPISRYLAKHLNLEEINQCTVVVAKDIHQMAKFITEGNVDIYIDSPFPSMAVSRLSGSKFLVRRWKKGVGAYHSVIFARKDSSIERLDDLKGKMIAFEEPHSSSGCLLPKIVLMQEGLKLTEKRDSADPVGTDEVGYTFSWEDENTMLWVFRKKVSAGAIDNQNYVKEAKDNIESLKIIFKSFPIPRQIVSYRADLDQKIVDRIKEILIKMDKSENGRKTLQEFEMTTKFDEIPDHNITFLLDLQKFIDVAFGIQ